MGSGLLRKGLLVMDDARDALFEAAEAAWPAIDVDVPVPLEEAKVEARPLAPTAETTGGVPLPVLITMKSS